MSKTHPDAPAADASAGGVAGRSPAGSTGFCPVCGAALEWTSTASLWPTKRATQAAIPSFSATCASCGRTLTYAVVGEPGAGRRG
jgi:hypothetical protein